MMDELLYLWVDDRAEFMRQFLLYSHVLTADEIESFSADEQIPETPPTLAQFRENIDKYNGVADTVSKMPDTQVFNQWLRIDTRGFKTLLHNVVRKWSSMFIEHLQQHVTTTLTNLQSFIQDATTSLEQDLPDGDYNALVSVMQHLNAVEGRRGATDACFEPLNETVLLLRAYEIELPDQVHKQLSDLPSRWEDCKKMSENVGHQARRRRPRKWRS